jgi:transcriptional regulator with XRE-family HTH domain
MEEHSPVADVFRERLKKAREVRGWSQAELGEKAAMPGSSIAHFETGTRKPSFESLRRMANALEITTDYLLGRVDSPDLAQAGDPLFRDIGKLSGDDREIAKGFLEMLAKRNAAKKDKDP